MLIFLNKGVGHSGNILHCHKTFGCCKCTCAGGKSVLHSKKQDKVLWMKVVLTNTRVVFFVPFNDGTFGRSQEVWIFRTVHGILEFWWGDFHCYISWKLLWFDLGDFVWSLPNSLRAILCTEFSSLRLKLCHFSTCVQIFLVESNHSPLNLIFRTSICDSNQIRTLNCNFDTLYDTLK